MMQRSLAASPVGKADKACASHVSASRISRPIRSFSPAACRQCFRRPRRGTPAGAQPEGSEGGSEDKERPAPKKKDDMFDFDRRSVPETRESLKVEIEQMMEEMEVNDMEGIDRLLSGIAKKFMGPLLESQGITEDPKTFFIDIVKLATALHLITLGILFYGLELGAQMETGEALRCTGGLALGYLTRPLVNIERLVWPVFGGGLKLLIDVDLELQRASDADIQALLNKMGVSLACAFFIPQAVWGWDTRQCLQLIGPVAAGWVLFDLAYAVAVVYKGVGRPRGE